MKKFSFLFAALALMSIVCSAFAENDLSNPPAIDEAAEDYLGKWYMYGLCYGKTCIPVGNSGDEAILEMNTDYTMSLYNASDKDNPDTYNWYVEDGVVYYLEEDKAREEFTARKLEINENGELVMGDETVYVTYTRENPVIYGSGEMKEDAKIEDFVGEWDLYSMKDEEVTFPVALLGLFGKLVVKEDNTLDFEMGEDSEKDIAFELKDGKISGTLKDEEGKDNQFEITYHADGSLVMSISMTDEASELELIYVHEEQMPSHNFNDLTEKEN